MTTHILSLTPFRRIFKDYFTVCETYYDAIRFDSLNRIEAVDIGQRSLHNEGSQLLVDRLKGKIDIDFSYGTTPVYIAVCALSAKVKGLWNRKIIVHRIRSLFFLSAV